MLAEAGIKAGRPKKGNRDTLSLFSVSNTESKRWQLVAAGIAASFSQRWAAEVEMPAALSAAYLPALASMLLVPPFPPRGRLFIAANERQRWRCRRP